MFLPHLPCPKCVPPSFQSVLVITADFGRADTSKSSQVVVSSPDRAAGHQEAPGLPSKDPNLQNAHLRGGRLAKPQFPFVSVEAAVECAQVGGRLGQTTHHNPGDTFLCPQQMRIVWLVTKVLHPN